MQCCVISPASHHLGDPVSCPLFSSLLYTSCLNEVQRLQNAAARLVSNVAKYDHITPTLVKLHWLPVRFRVILKIAMLAHKCIYGNAPEYLRALVKVNSSVKSCIFPTSKSGTIQPLVTSSFLTSPDCFDKQLAQQGQIHPYVCPF